MANSELRGKVVVITGASSGLGKGAAREFALGGAKLVLSARRGKLLEQLAEECRQFGADALACPADVSNCDDVRDLCERAVYEFGQIDVWVNDAGASALGRFEEVPLGDHVKVVEVNLLGTIYGSYMAIEQFQKQPTGGVLINLSSALGKIPAPYQASYVAAKFGIVGLGGALRQELRENRVDKIKVCTVMPMAMDTPFFDHTANYTGHEAMPIPPLYEPEAAIEVIVRMATEPQDEVVVGAAGKLSNFAHHLMPGAVENYLGGQTHKAQYEEAPNAANTAGSLYRPMSIGTNVSAGRLHTNTT